MVAVETQPGLSELFLNIEKVKPESVANKEADKSTTPARPKVIVVDLMVKTGPCINPYACFISMMSGKLTSFLHVNSTI